MLEADSLIKARYALTILRVAQAADRQTAARLVGGLFEGIGSAGFRSFAQGDDLAHAELAAAVLLIR